MNAEKKEMPDRMPHTVSMRERNVMEIGGVTDVISFDEEAVVLNTVCGTMNVEGESLHVRVLDLEEGIVTLDGTIGSVVYLNHEDAGKNERAGFFGKLFR